jgi:hypothetical protein
MPAKRDASRHGGAVTRRYEGSVPGGRSVRPHASRNADSRREKIRKMKQAAKQSPKIE